MVSPAMRILCEWVPGGMFSSATLIGFFGSRTSMMVVPFGARMWPTKAKPLRTMTWPPPATSTYPTCFMPCACAIRLLLLKSAAAVAINYCGKLLGFDAGRLDHLRPFGDFGFHVSRKRIGRAADHIDALRR